MQLAELKHILNSFEDMILIQQETLVHYANQISVVEETHFFEILRGVHSMNQGTPLALKDVQLQVGVNVVYQEAHVLTEEHGLPEVWVR